MTETVTHIAAGWLTVSGRLIQRCGVCGEKLVDSKGTAAPIETCRACKGTGHSPQAVFEATGHLTCQECKGRKKLAYGPGTWQPGRLVRVHPGNPTRWELLPDSDQVPDDCCISLVE